MLAHEQVVTIRFDDADPAGVVFYPRAIALAHAVTEEMIRRSALGWAAWFASPDHAAPLVHAEADFMRPMRAGESFTARARVEKLGGTSVGFVVEFAAADGTVAARVRANHVLVDKGSGRPVPLNEEIRRAFG
jgi:acyl-CoA thioesterase FadM